MRTCAPVVGSKSARPWPTLGLDSPHERRCDQGGGPSEPQERIPKAETNARCLVLHRGNNRENLFVEPRNYRHYLQLNAPCVETVADTYACCLLRNHCHLLVRVKAGEERQQTFEVSKQTSILAYPWWRVACGGWSSSSGRRWRGRFGGRSERAP